MKPNKAPIKGPVKFKKGWSQNYISGPSGNVLATGLGIRTGTWIAKAINEKLERDNGRIE